VTPAKSGGQDVGLETCLEKSLKRRSFPVFGFSAGGIWRLAEAKEGSRRRNCASEDQDLGVCDVLSPIQEPKWKSWIGPG